MNKNKEGKRAAKLKKRVRVKKSVVGRGVFARKRFREEAVIGEVTGMVRDPDFESDYCMDLGKHAVLDPEGPFRFLNHSCNPNCQLMLWKSRKFNGRKIGRLWVETIRAVAAGDELTIDYAWPADAAIRCLCGAENCRGWVADEHESRSLSRH